ncbi:MAG: hypothetical protein M0D57_15510 [Sphingobacteriales bacterium JAD_PAG50586_3]|nr:MAG: hypothetical protein M0D57_15510 [Sphingobacteriales bacterium JAD_PAG50586_3]
MLTLLNFGFSVNNIVKSQPIKRGDIYYTDKTFYTKGFLLKRIFKLDDLTIIKGYYYVPPSLEEVCCIDFIFNNGKKILFVGTRTDHLEFINMILVRELNCTPIYFYKTIIFDNDEGKDYQTFYLRELD